MIALPLLALALADPLPGPVEPLAEEEQPELVPVESAALRDDRYSFALGMSVNAGAYRLERDWVAAATVAFDLHADFGRLALVLSPHLTMHVSADIAALFGVEGQVVFRIGEYVAVSAGTEQVVSVSRYQSGAFYIGPSVRPFIVRSGRHRLSLQITWLALGFNERVWPSCNECNLRPLPFYTLGYGVLF